MASNDPTSAVTHPRFMGMRGRTLDLMVSFIATTGFLLFGYDQGVMSGIISAVPFNNYFPETKHNSTWQGFVTAIYEIGCLFGAIMMLLFGDAIGRRKGIMAGATIMIIGALVQVTSFKGHNAMAQFIVGRVITGIGNGMNTATIPTYQAECSKTKNHGLLICIEGGIIAFGSLIAYWIDYGCSFGPDNLTWRFPIGFQAVFGAIVLIGMIGLPESPRWLLTKDRHEDAAKVIAALRGNAIDDEETRFEAHIIMDSIRASGHKGGTTPFSALFTNGKTQHFRRMMLGATSQLMQQIGGCNAVIYYFPLLFENSIGATHDLSLLLGGVNMIVYAAFATTSWFIIERAGRRKLFIAGTLGQGLSMVLVFAALIPGTKSAAKGAAVGLFTYIASFAATWLPLPWLYPAEINPIKTRGKANAVSIMITPIMIDHIGWGTYLFFAVVNACFLPFLYFYYPETKNRSLEEIDLIFAKGHLENISYVKAAKALPILDARGIEQMQRQYGFFDDDDSDRVYNDGPIEKGDIAAVDEPKI